MLDPRGISESGGTGRLGHRSDAAFVSQELEIQYTPSKWVVRRGAAEALDTFSCLGTQATKEARATQRNELNVTYGSGDRAKLDIYFPKEDCRAYPVFVFYHGGFWQSVSKDESAFMVSPLTAQGVAVVIVDYNIAPKGTMDLMVEQVTQSLVFLQQRFPDNKGLYLCGHSAGAHLISMMLLVDWTKQRLTPNLQGLFLVSGIYDLEPIIYTSQNDLLSLTLKDALRNSPQLRLEEKGPEIVVPDLPILVIVGQDDSPEFHRQSWEFYQMLQQAGWKAFFQELPEVDHFEIIWQMMECCDLIKIILKTIFPKL